MNISDRIQSLRKIKGVSQEELSDRVGVSRQAVSKWESEQAMPDIDKIIVMSDYFGVTTDYLLKGIEPVSEAPASKKADAMVFAIAATAINFIGLVTAIIRWYVVWDPFAAAYGASIMAAGCAVFGIGTIFSKKESIGKALKVFVSANIWILAYIPLACMINGILGIAFRNPFLIIDTSLEEYGNGKYFWPIYIIICAAVTFAVNYKRKK
ncbi:MAG: helix-turn-helix transcriptional regulator [Oscillospiraceae bacterium]|nr:helix-turn-helix transcriptional regulator [Oscillospiraceae bacterium]